MDVDRLIGDIALEMHLTADNPFEVVKHALRDFGEVTELHAYRMAKYLPVELGVSMALAGFPLERELNDYGLKCWDRDVEAAVRKAFRKQIAA